MGKDKAKFRVRNAAEMYAALGEYKTLCPKNTLFYSWRKDGFLEDGNWKKVPERGWEIIKACTDFLNGLVDKVPRILRFEFYYDSKANQVLVDTSPTAMFERETGFSYYSFKQMVEDWQNSREYYDDFTASEGFRDELMSLVNGKRAQIEREINPLIERSIGTEFSKAGFKLKFEADKSRTILLS